MKETISSGSHRSFKKFTLSLTVISLMSVCIVLLFSLNAYAYNLEGPKWAGQPAPHNCCAYIYFQRGPATTYDATAYSGAISAWNSSPAYIVFYSGSGMVYASDTYNSSANWDGITYYGWDRSNHFTYADIELNYFYTVNYPAQKIQGIAVHEMGHSVGLAHAGGCVIMVGDSYTRWDVCRIQTPQTDDNNGIDALY